MRTVYLNGEYLPEDQARVPVGDRGFLFGDGVYEVTPAYRGRLFLLERHVDRLRRGLAALRIDYDAPLVGEIKRGLLDRNGLGDAPVSYIYIQVTRGVAPRTHAFPDPPVQPTVYGFAGEYRRPSREVWMQGIRAVTLADQRWARADIKAIALLPNVLAQQRAVDADAQGAIFVRDGMVLEGSHNNLFVVLDGVLTTAPKSNYILHGITRDFVVELAADAGLALEERAVPLADLYRADEVFFTGTTTEVRPAVEIDGRAVGDGRVGPVAQELYERFLAGTRAELVPAGRRV